MIRLTYKYLKPVALFLSIVVLFQCCRIYDRKSVTIEEALDINYKRPKRIKIEMNDGKKLKVDSIYYKGDELYALRTAINKIYDKEKGRNVTIKTKIEFSIEPDKINKIRLYNKTKSSVATLFLIIGPIVATTVFLIISARPHKCLDPSCD